MHNMPGVEYIVDMGGQYGGCDFKLHPRHTLMHDHGMPYLVSKNNTLSTFISIDHLLMFHR